MDNEKDYAVTHGAAIVPDLECSESNIPRNCWCGDSKEAHMTRVEDNSQICNLCKCVGYVEDRWAK